MIQPFHFKSVRKSYIFVSDKYITVENDNNKPQLKKQNIKEINTTLQFDQFHRIIQ